ncbi:MAG: plastocyanin/azurin family copper-binding protein [Gemmatimonadota bacterium]
MSANRIPNARRTALLVCVCGLAWACSTDNFTGIHLGGGAPVSITDQLTFVPDTITVPVDGTVLWTNNSTSWHTVTADPSLAQDSASVLLPDSAAPFNSDSIAPNGTFSHRFTVAGTYKYFSIPDEASGMVGWVVVQ